MPAIDPFWNGGRRRLESVTRTFRETKVMWDQSSRLIPTRSSGEIHIMHRPILVVAGLAILVVFGGLHLSHDHATAQDSSEVMYWFSVTLSLGVLELATWKWTKDSTFWNGGRCPPNPLGFIA